MKNILIVDPYSSGKNYIADILKRNYRPVLLRTKMGSKFPGSAELTVAQRRKFGDVAVFLEEQDTYEQTLEMIRGYQPVLALPGSENGVEMAFRLAEDLGLPCNPYDKIDQFVHKDAMHAALKRAGIRYIRGTTVNSLEEALDFYRKEKLNGCVIKPSRGAGTVGVHLCDSEEELIAAFHAEFGNRNIFMQEQTVLLQELIRGTEYIVNTVSVDGKHRLSSIWRYKKKKVAGGGNVYDYSENIGTLEAGHAEMVKYAFDVADAIGYRNGAIHGEYMIDEKGPVLIEVNCRVMGGSFDAEILDRVNRQHETDNVLDSLLSPEWHEKMMRMPYRTYAKAGIKSFIVPEDVSISSVPVLSILRHLKSCYSATIGAALTGFMERTVDFETTGGNVYLVNEDERVFWHDMEFLRKAEQQYAQMLFTGRKIDKTGWKEQVDDIPAVMKKCGCDRSVLILSNDEKLDVAACILRDRDKREVNGKFNWAILDLDYKEDEDLERMTEDFYFLAETLTKGGHIIVPERTYRHFPCGRAMIEMLCESVDLIIEAPGSVPDDVVVATVRG